MDDADVDASDVDDADVDAYAASLNRDIQEACITRGANQQPLAVWINGEQPMTPEMSNQLVFRTDLSSQQAMHMGGANQQAASLSNRGKQVPFSLLLPVVQSLLVGDKSRSMQLRTLFQRFQSNEITKEEFVPQMRNIVGDQMIKMAGYKLQLQAIRDSAAQKHIQEPSIVPPESSDFIRDNNALQQYEVGHHGVSHNIQATQMSSSSKVPSAPSPINKTSVGQKKPLEALGCSPSPSSKKRKMSGGDQSIEELNDVAAVSGVDLREEEELLLSFPKEDGQVLQTSRRVMQEEEGRLILQKIPLQKKLTQIMAKSGLKSIGSDVEKCLSLCFEERIRGLISSLIKLSKQRVDIEKFRHKTFITTDVQEKIMAINQKVRVEWEKKQTEEEKLERSIEEDGRIALDGDKKIDESRARPVKANKEVDAKMRTTAANVAARAAVGGDDMLQKWQRLAEQARQKIEGGPDGVSGLQAGNNVSRTTSTEKRGQSSSTPGSIRKPGRNQVIMAHDRVSCAISVKDLIAVLEREAQMSRSTLMYRLYDKSTMSESSAHAAM